MANAGRDDNQVPTKVASVSGGTVTLKAEHATGYMKAIIFNQSLSSPTINAAVAGTDDNNVKSALASFNGIPKTLKATHVGNYLRAVNS